MAWELIEEKPNYQRFRDTENPQRFKLATSKRRFGRRDIEQVGRVVTIHHPTGDLSFDIDNDSDFHLENGTLRAVLQEWNTGDADNDPRWDSRPRGTPSANFGQRSVTLFGVTTQLSDEGKFSFSVKPGAGKYRLVIYAVPNVAGTPKTLNYSSFNGDPPESGVGCKWPNGFRAWWRPMAADIEAVDVNEARVVLTTYEFDIAGGQSKTFDPTFGPVDAAYTADCDNDIKNEDINDQYAGRITGATLVRCATRFGIAALPIDATVTNVALTTYVDTVNLSGGAELWQLGPYNGDGRADPELDIVATFYSRCGAVDTDNYMADISAYRTVGGKTHSDLGAQAEADVEAARQNIETFAFAWMLDPEADDWDYCIFDGSPDTNPQTLEVEYFVGVTQTMEGFRFRNDDDDEANATWRQLQDVNDSIAKLATFRFRGLTDFTGDPGAQGFEVWYKETLEAAAEYRKVPLT